MIITDIHCHILPGVDDGSSGLDESIKMIYLAKREGIENIILTPHYHEGRKVASRPEREAAFKRLKDQLERLGVTMNLYLGNEVFSHEGMCDGLRSGEIATMNGTRYVLVEFHPSYDLARIKRGIYELLQGGFFPILAHIERYETIVRHPEEAYELHEMGCLFQVNSHTVTDGSFGMKRFFNNLMKEELVSFIATDAHRCEGSRAPKIAKCAKYIEKKYGQEIAKTIFEINPARLIAGQEIER